jgi:hypothetical protein
MNIKTNHTGKCFRQVWIKVKLEHLFENTLYVVKCDKLTVIENVHISILLWYLCHRIVHMSHTHKAPYIIYKSNNAHSYIIHLITIYLATYILQSMLAAAMKVVSIINVCLHTADEV